MAIKTADEILADLKVLPEYVAAEQFINTAIIPQFVAEKTNMVDVIDPKKDDMDFRRRVLFLLTKAGFTAHYHREQFCVTA